MTLKPGIHRLSKHEAMAFIEAHTDAVMYYLDGKQMAKTRSFVPVAQHVFPQLPRFENYISWDGFIDSVFEGLAEEPARKVIAYWDCHDLLAQTRPGDYEFSLLYLEDLVFKLGNPGNLDETIDLYVFLIDYDRGN